jgi:hypothetical protein
LIHLQIGGMSVKDCSINSRLHMFDAHSPLGTNEVMVTVDCTETEAMPPLRRLLPLLKPAGTAIARLRLGGGQLPADAMLACQELAAVTSLELMGCKYDDTVEAAVNTLVGQTPALASFTITQSTIKSLPAGVCALSTLSKLVIYGQQYELPEGNYLAGELAFCTGPT